MVLLECSGCAADSKHTHKYRYSLLTTLPIIYSGTEHTEVRYEENEEYGNDERRNVTRTDSASRSIVDIRLPVNDATFIDKSGRVSPGYYQIPFSLQLPSYLPGSIYINRDSEGSCQIMYAVKAVLKGSGVLWNYHTQKDIQVQAKPMDSLPPEPLLAAPVNERVNMCCCFNKGSISLGGKVSDVRMYPGSQATVSMSCRNYSTATLRRVHARLRQEIKWNAGGRSARTNDNVVVLDFPSMLHHVAPNPGRFDPMHVQSDLENIYREIEQSTHNGTLYVPHDVLDTYSGHLFTVQHRLEIEVKTACCITDPSVVIPVRIGRPPLNSSTDYGASATSPEYQPPITADAVLAPLVVVDGEDVSLPVIEVPSSDVFPVSNTSAPYEDEIKVSPIAPAVEQPTFPQFMREMKGTASHLELVERRIRDSSWSFVWRNMTPDEFRRLLASVVMGFDQPRVAEAVAKEIADFRCEYVVAALRSTMDFQRGSMVETLLRYCSDLKQNQKLIKRELDDWELIVTERSFARALQDCR